MSLGAGAYRATELTRGPWNPEHQHAGPPIALAARELERAALGLGMAQLARLTASLLRPVPIAELAVEVQTDYAGRNAAHLSARLLAAGKEVARFSALAQREAPIEMPDRIPGHPLPQAPRTVEASAAARFPFLRQDVGYPDLVETRLAAGEFFRGPSAVWFRLCRPLIEGEAPTSIQRVAVAADSGNGISAALDFRRFTFVNSDLTINLLRRTEGEWICIDARTLVGPAGGGVAEARVFDAGGLAGRSTQSLQIRLRE